MIKNNGLLVKCCVVGEMKSREGEIEIVSERLRLGSKYIGRGLKKEGGNREI